MAYQSDSPEDLLDCGWQCLPGILRFCSTETNKLRTGKGECSGNEHGAQTLETVVEGPGIVPVTMSIESLEWL